MPAQLLAQLKARAANQLFGDPMPGVMASPGITPDQRGGGSPYGAQVGGPGEAERVADQARRGGAPFTAKGLGQAFGNALGITGSGAITTGLASIAEKAMGMSPGSLGGFSNIEGHYPIDMKGYPKNRVGFSAARQAAASRSGGGRSVEGNRARGGAGAFGGGQKTSGGMLGGAGGV